MIALSFNYLRLPSGGFVQDQDARVSQHSAGDTDQLALADERFTAPSSTVVV
jgi:hypothetical protein